MNLFWLKYISYASLIGTAIFYILLRKDPRSPARRTRVLCYLACLVLACVAWYVQEHNADLHSPRRLLIGTVASVNANHHKGGNISDDFQLRVDGGNPSPEFSTDTVASTADAQPIHQGDTLGVLYRTWDGVPLTIDELAGQHPGWHYSRYDNGMGFVFGVSLMGVLLLAGLLFIMRKAGPVEPPSSVRLDLAG